MPNAALAAYSMIRKAIIDFILNKTSGRGFRQEGEIPVVDSHVACKLLRKSTCCPSPADAADLGGA